MQGSRDGHETKAIGRNYLLRIGEDKQEAHKDVRQDVLQVITMGSAYTFHVLVVGYDCPSDRQILGVYKDLEGRRKSLTFNPLKIKIKSSLYLLLEPQEVRVDAHEKDLEHQQAGVRGIDAKDGIPRG